jgi:hypothetical protein
MAGTPSKAVRKEGCPSLREALMGDNSASTNTSGLPSGWRVEIDGGSALPQGVYSMIELDARTCAFERPGGPSFEMSAADVVRYEKTGVLHVTGPLAGNDNSIAAE